MTVDLDNWTMDGQHIDINDPAAVAELRRLWWIDEAREVAARTGLPSDEESLAKLAEDLKEMSCP